MAQQYVKDEMGKHDNLIPMSPDQMKEFFANSASPLPRDMMNSTCHMMPLCLPESVMQSVYESMSVEERAAIDNAEHRCGFSRCLVIKDLSKCAACKNVYYCSTYHQRLNWPEHKLVCKKEVPK